MSSESTDKARASLWLRSERAMGLRAVKLPAGKHLAKRSAAVTAPAKEPAVAAPPRVAKPIAAPIAARPPMTALHVCPPAAPPRPAAVPAPLDIVTPFSSPVLSTSQKKAQLAELNEKQVRLCRQCRLHEQRSNTVFGEGNPDAKLLFIGEGPGENEDLQGRPFVGRAGELLTKMILAMGLQREDVFIANIVKCRPPENRQPAGDEVAACTPYLLQQIEIVRPRVIVTLGLPATRFMLNSQDSMGRLRGKWYAWRGIRLMPIYHPSYVIRSYTPQVRATVWGDLKLVMTELGLESPARGKAL